VPGNQELSVFLLHNIFGLGRSLSLSSKSPTIGRTWLPRLSEMLRLAHRAPLHPLRALSPGIRCCECSCASSALGNLFAAGPARSPARSPAGPAPVAALPDRAPGSPAPGPRCPGVRRPVVLGPVRPRPGLHGCPRGRAVLHPNNIPPSMWVTPAVHEAA